LGRGKKITMCNPWGLARSGGEWRNGGGRGTLKRGLAIKDKKEQGGVQGGKRRGVRLERRKRKRRGNLKNQKTCEGKGP